MWEHAFYIIKRIKEADLQVLLDNGFSEKIAHKIIDYYNKYPPV